MTPDAPGRYPLELPDGRVRQVKVQCHNFQLFAILGDAAVPVGTVEGAWISRNPSEKGTGRRWLPVVKAWFARLAEGTRARVPARVEPPASATDPRTAAVPGTTVRGEANPAQAEPRAASGPHNGARGTPPGR